MVNRSPEDERRDYARKYARQWADALDQTPACALTEEGDVQHYTLPTMEASRDYVQAQRAQEELRALKRKREKEEAQHKQNEQLEIVRRIMMTLAVVVIGSCVMGAIGGGSLVLIWLVGCAVIGLIGFIEWTGRTR